MNDTQDGSTQQDVSPADQIRDLELQHTVDAEIIARLEAEGIVDRKRIVNLELALVSARRIGAAIGILMATQQLTDEQAFAVLAAASQSLNLKLRQLAEHIMLTGTLPDRAQALERQHLAV